VLLTGHTGFKGGWAALILHALGAEVHGFALPPEDREGLFAAAHVADLVQHRIGDVRDPAAVATAVADARPEVVIHMAAQALVRPSYADPVGTYATNVMGTVHVLEAVRQAPEVRCLVVITSDKCYENDGRTQGYREGDRLGGHDPYSDSKACAELVTDAYRRSFFSGRDATRIASARAGNVIGGGDFARDRLVPDAVRAFRSGETLRIRNPQATRPWQHVLDPVIGYLRLVEHLVGREGFAEAWNFGPGPASEVPVSTIVERLVALWGEGARWEHDRGEHPHEASRLALDCTKAATRLGWHPLIDLDTALRMSIDWYAALDRGEEMRAFSLRQIAAVLDRPRS
jgi:CDP-glucose 4,6-dehydratase